MLVASFSSLPAMAESTSALSFTPWVIGPIWSREDAKAIRPYLETAPYVGFMPTTPQNAAGWRIEPPVSEPRANGASYAATHAALPPLLPPGTQSGFAGFLVILNAEFYVEPPMANSSIFVLPSITAPAFSSFCITVAS